MIGVSPTPRPRRPIRALAFLAVSLAMLSCVDALGPGGLDRVAVQLNLVGPQTVSPAETAALSAAFDVVDEYTVEIADEATEEVYLSTTMAITPSGDFHILDVVLPRAALGRTVRITLVASSNGTEMYRSVTVTTLSTATQTTGVSLEVRYTGPGVRGRVTDTTGNGMGGISVALIAGQVPVATAATEADGTYVFPNVAPGSYVVVPTPSTPYSCPASRAVQIQTITDAIVANFVSSAVFCGTDVLVLAGGDLAFDDTPAVQSMLAQDQTLTTARFFYVNQTPGIAQLRQYDVVLLFMNGLFDESPTIGDEVARYVGEGGNLVIATFYWQGRSDSGLGAKGWGALEAVDPFTSTGGATYQLGFNDRTSTVAHPLTTGVSTVTSTGFWGGVAAKAGTSVVARWSDQASTPMIGYQVLNAGQRIVAVSLYPASGTSATGDWQTMFLNAVRWAGAAGGPSPQ